MQSQVGSLSRLVLQPRVFDDVPGGLIPLVFDVKSSSLLRRQLQKRSEREFILDLHSKLCSYGLSPEVANGHVIEVVNNPNVAFIRSTESAISVLQAVTAHSRETGPADAMLVTVRVAITMDKPPRVFDASLEVDPVDLVEVNDQCAITERVEDWSMEFSVRGPAQGMPGAPKGWAWLGDPRACGYRDVPANWDSRLRLLGFVLGMRSSILTSPAQAKAQSAHGEVDLFLQPHGAKGWQEVVGLVENRDLEVLQIGQAGSPFSNLMASARLHLLPRVLNPARSQSFAARQIEPGEIVYHRKIGNSRHFDIFDEGSPEPCSHGAESFDPWGGDKASKGMARRYSNFGTRGVKLLHCRRYPNCGMYALSRASE